MSHRTTDNPEWDDDGSGWEDEIVEGADDDDEPSIACPHCHKQIHEDSQRCPLCENYISTEDVQALRRPWLMIGGVGVCLYVVYRWIVG
jgi:uncharacterized paraquat-inducible protein A